MTPAKTPAAAKAVRFDPTGESRGGSSLPLESSGFGTKASHAVLGALGTVGSHFAQGENKGNTLK
ncbi:MAG: hypothetical protein JWO83_294 [Caulobacteraceae bacterium]|nr:hypothetical protein [Caulobacteraceae bacterium]